MKKLFIIISGILLLLVCVLIAIPLFFKPALVDAVKSTLNKNLNAQVEFEELDLSVFRNFPGVTIQLSKVSVTGKGEFGKDTLLFIEEASAKMNMISLFRKTGRKVDEITLIRPKLNFVVDTIGNVNWDITTGNSTEKVPSRTVENKETAQPFSLLLEKIIIEEATLNYTDREINMVQVFKGINLSLKGKMYGAATDLQVEGKAESYSLFYKNTAYISNISLETKSLLNVDFEKTGIEIRENELLVNRLPLEVTGSVRMPSDSTFFDLSVKTKDSDFANFLALVPKDYEKYLQNIKTAGTASVSGVIKGLYFDEIYPAIDFKIDVANGNLKYSGLPEEIKNIKAEISLVKPEGIPDLTELQIKNAHLEIKNNPVDLTLLLKNMMSDPYFEGAFVGKINFDELKNALPLDSVNVSGTIDANLFVKGNYSSVEKEQYDKIKSDGIVLLDNFLYDSPKLTRKILVPSGKLDFSPQNVNLSQLKVKVGQSDFNLSGKVSDYLNYIFKDGTLKGDLQLVSSFVNLNELLRLQKKEPKPAASDEKKAETSQTGVSAGESDAKLVFDVPRNIDFTFRSDIKKALFDQLPVSDINGLITAKNGKLILNNLSMNMLDGEMKVTGSYENTPQDQPVVDFGIEISKFDIPVAFQSLSGFQKMAPIAGQSQGKISTTIKMNGQLTNSFKIIPASVDGTGLFSTENLKIAESPVFAQLKGILLPEKLKNVNIEDFKANFNIENGNIDLKPFKTKVAGQETTVFGTLSAENLINMRLDFKVNRDAFGTDIQNVLSAIPGNQKIKVLPAGVLISGPVGKPEVKVDLSETRKTITDAAKGELKNSLDQLGKGLQKLFKK